MSIVHISVWSLKAIQLRTNLVWWLKVGTVLTMEMEYIGLVTRALVVVTPVGK